MKGALMIRRTGFQFQFQSLLCLRLPRRTSRLSCAFVYSSSYSQVLSSFRSFRIVRFHVPGRPIHLSRLYGRYKGHVFLNAQERRQYFHRPSERRIGRKQFPVGFVVAYIEGINVSQNSAMAALHPPPRSLNHVWCSENSKVGEVSTSHFFLERKHSKEILVRFQGDWQQIIFPHFLRPAATGIHHVFDGGGNRSTRKFSEGYRQ